MVLLGPLGQLQQRRDGHYCRRFLVVALQPLRKRERKVTTRGITGQHDLFRPVSARPQPLVCIVAVVERHPQRMLRDQPIVDYQHG
ncbi:Uncharacterised protein [Mycobacterium tuberculosis]|nr:Uncharacterised protein [Mycobacterium tuberculosis]